MKKTFATYRTFNMPEINPTEDNMWISLLSGGKFNYTRPEDSEVEIEDIASALSNVCRFSGHLPCFYSVAQHLVNTSRIVPPEFAFTALMHDTAEAFTNDLPTPLKWTLPVFKELEVKIESAMANRFGFQYPYPEQVKLADTQMLLLEKNYVKLDNAEWTYYNDIEFEHLVDRVDLKGWQPVRAKREFMERFEELNDERLEHLRAQAA
jgi:5'-deoxynucleotidase YfbR-like HD superfamily hydrolase